MKYNKEDFFEKMHHYGTAINTKQIIFLFVGLLFLFAVSILYNLESAQIISLTPPFNTIESISLVLCALFYLYFAILFFKRNHIFFKKGILSAGITNLVFIMFPSSEILFIIYYFLPEYKDIIKSIFTYMTAITTAALAMIGVYYTIKKQLNENEYKLNLIFDLLNKGEKGIEKLDIKNSVGKKSITINLKNISNNFGYFVGVYRITGCDIHQIGDDIPYFPIAPYSLCSITNIKLNYGDDQLIIVYKDIGENFYYILLSSNLKFIEDVDKCDMDFLYRQLEITEKSKKNLKRNLFGNL